MRSEFYEHVIISSVTIAVVNYLVVVVANDRDHEAVTFELHAKQKPALAGVASIIEVDTSCAANSEAANQCESFSEHREQF